MSISDPSPNFRAHLNKAFTPFSTHILCCFPRDAMSMCGLLAAIFSPQVPVHLIQGNSLYEPLVASPRWWDVGCVTEISSWDSNGIHFFDLVRTKLTSTWFHPTRSNYGRSWILRPKNPESKQELRITIIPSIWRCPKIGVPPVIIHVIFGCSMK